jgi:hypothetical protein
MEMRIGQVFLSIAGESEWFFQALCRERVMRFRKVRCARQRDMVSRDRDVVVLEVSKVLFAALRLRTRARQIRFENLGL